VLNGDIVLENIRQNGCDIKDSNNRTSGWRVYKRTEQMEQSKGENII